MEKRGEIEENRGIVEGTIEERSDASKAAIVRRDV
jgi:hypothetical protein